MALPWESIPYLTAIIMDAKNWIIDETKVLSSYEEAMRQTPQPQRWHGEGDVYTHTMMVLDALREMPEYKALTEHQQFELRLAAMLHDIGKCRTTQWVDGDWHSPHHGSTGSKMARQMLWLDYGICGERDLLELRETVCLLIRYHDFPLHAILNDNMTVMLHRIAANGELVTDFSIKLLCLLAEADIRGRLCDDMEDVLERIELCRNAAKDEGCFDTPYTFASAHTQRAYMAGRDVWKGQELFDDTWGEVIVMSGLPGTGKDTYINKHWPDLPVVSLDDLRVKYRVSPTDNQGHIVQMAKEQAKSHLRVHQPFIWNATNLTNSRQNIIQLFESYRARVRIVYLETTVEEQIRRNNNRDAVVPQQVIDDMLAKIVPPERGEATRVEWHCI